MAPRRDQLLIYAAAATRAFGIGLFEVVLGGYLSRVGVDFVELQKLAKIYKRDIQFFMTV